MDNIHRFSHGLAYTVIIIYLLWKLDFEGNMYRLKHGFWRHMGYNGTIVASALGQQARGWKPQRCHYSLYGMA